MVRKDREQIQEGIKGYIGKENRRTAPAGKTNREQVADLVQKQTTHHSIIIWHY